MFSYVRKGETMSTEIARRETAPLALVEDLAELIEDAQDAARAAKSAATVRSYRRSWATFQAWCEGHGLSALPAEPGTVALFLMSRAKQGRKVATLQVDLAAISQAHKAAGLASPRSGAQVAEVMKGIRRTKGVAQVQKTAITPAQLRAIVAELPETLLGLRDRALLLVGFITACRRSELVALDVADLAPHARGRELVVRRSKTDQEGRGISKAVPYSTACPGDDSCRDALCPVHALERWIAAAGISEGPIFRSVNRHGRVGDRLTGAAVARVVKRSLELVGIPAEDFAGHSLRSGFVTAAVEAGKSSLEVRQQTGHRSDVILARYFRSKDRHRAAAGIL